jgi:glycosyltransferase involved in cell wall biosynthesis
MRDIIITGSGRSGTSLAAGIFASSGAFVGGRPHAPNAANPKGFFETHEVGGINEALLAPRLPHTPRLSAGQRWLGLPDTEGRTPPDPALDVAIERLTEQRPFCFKDPRFVWTIDAWRSHLVDPVILCIFREPAVTAASIVKECASAPYLADVDMTYERAVEVWSEMMREAIARSERESGWHFVHYDQLLTPEGLDRLSEWTGREIARDFPDTALKRTRCMRSVSADTAGLYRKLCSLAEYEGASPVRVDEPDTAPEAKKDEEGAAPELSVVLCTYNRRETLKRSLASFQSQTASGRFELIVVNDGSTDGTGELLDSMEFSVPTTVVHRANGRLAAARNTGIEAARGKLLLFVNDDTIAFPELVEEHLAMHARLAPRRASVLGTFEQPAHALENALTRHLEQTDLVFRYGDMVPGETYDANRFWTANVSIDAAAVREAGCFDEDFQHYGAEDVDLGVRLQRLGVTVVYHDRARAHHEHVLDVDDFKHRTRLVGKAFVRLFTKHPDHLANADFAWIRGESIASFERRVAEDRARMAGIEEMVREAASVNLGVLEGAEGPVRESFGALVEAVLDSLKAGLGELNVHWWRESFAAGLREFGLESFAELEAKARTVEATPVTDEELNTVVTALTALREKAAAGEFDVSTIDSIRLAAAVASCDMEQNENVRHVYVAILNDLAVMRFQIGDLRGARRVLEAALAVDEENELALTNLEEVARSVATQTLTEPVSSPPKPTLVTDVEPWMKVLIDEGERVIGFRGKDVVELGGPVPERAALATGAQTWRACAPGRTPVQTERYGVEDAELSELPFADASCDVVFSACSLQRAKDLEATLAEVRRVLRPGGAFVADFSPIWSCAVGHSLWERDDDGACISFDDEVVPRWGHLLLAPDELAWYLSLVFSPASARRAVTQIFENSHVNRLFDGEYRKVIMESGLDASGLGAKQPWKGAVPTPALRAALDARFPGGGDFSNPGFAGVLVKRHAAVAAAS